jgi:hypothetical protein
MNQLEMLDVSMYLDSDDIRSELMHLPSIQFNYAGHRTPDALHCHFFSSLFSQKDHLFTSS